jgi:hypothetical protein
MLINSYFCFLELKLITNKKIKMAHNIKPGSYRRSSTGNFNYAKEKGFALPAVNVTGSNTINGV